MSIPEQLRSGWAVAGRSAAELKACCAATYQADAAAVLLGDSYHPGGLALTRRLGVALGLRPGQRVADVASGPGSSAFLLAAEFGVDVEGIDLGDAIVAAANNRAVDKGISEHVAFHVGDAERLPLDDQSVEAVISECALCIFPDKPTAAAEMSRILRPGGRVGITDVTLDPDRLDPELASLAGWVACLADARPVSEYSDYLRRAGLEVNLTEAHDDALADMIDTIDARLSAYRMAGAPALACVDVDSVRRKVSIAAQAVADGIAGYSLIIASKPTY